MVAVVEKMSVEENEMFAGVTGRTGRTEEEEEGMGRFAVREIWLERLAVKLVRKLKRVELEAEPDGRHCSGQSSSR